MIITINSAKIKDALEFIVPRTGAEKRLFSPTPGKEPYWHHLIRVYHWLSVANETDEDLLVASLLHDAVEDNHATLPEIHEAFSEQVAEIVDLLSEQEFSNHDTNHNRSSYFQRIISHPNQITKTKAIKIKTADRYDNLIGISFTDFSDKKKQYAQEVKDFFYDFADQVNMTNLINKGMQIMQGTQSAPDITVTQILKHK